ncbi:hypothetical protein AUK11_04615 [bacterium CG2_30_37_16]|nr:MAG: hypothetical protein AUK11_04615 [bacterium CG2_30_37_16]PIP30502.1 MAG: hypothetical protein COX25_04365 [bacterium (Candidatus Howlettbacteria) CG23_combo_of_CG06-09_8_20_14_all_37_9]PIX99293.1 MAG: hypothetical protein COZ22_02865 [bacterium (Candidatus Howlettbacteria) CG_4_10_14_3_um_filter_37_10]PJB06161.1 MAG: hypothetical protein CO123_02615 [bacterium (Candidatus Howlettbacteria) CG_4_9_14_3_um_filter_37_10]
MSKIRIKEELWEQVEACLKEQKSSAYKLAIIEADKILNNLITLKGVPGESTSDKVMKIKEKFSDLTGLVKAFQTKDKILNHLTYNVSSEEADAALNALQTAINDLDKEGSRVSFSQKVRLFFEFYMPKKLRKLEHLALAFIGFLAFILFLADTGWGQSVSSFFLNIARFFYYVIVKYVLIAGVVLGIIFLMFMYFEKKNKR